MKFVYIFLFSFLVYGEKVPFQIGEVLNYKASFGSIKAAHAQLKVIKKDTIDKTPVYHVQFNAKTKGVLNLIFPIEDQIDLWIDEKSLLPRKIKINIKEGKFRKNTDIYIPKSSNYIISNNDTIYTSKSIHSSYSLFYFIRKPTFSIKNDNLVYTIQNKKIIPLNLEIDKNIKIMVPAGNFNCFRVLPKRSDKQEFKNNAQMSMLFSNDNKRYPIKIWINLKYGSLVLELEEVIN